MTSSVVSLTLLDIWPLRERAGESQLSTGDSKVKGLPTHYTSTKLQLGKWWNGIHAGLKILWP